VTAAQAIQLSNVALNVVVVSVVVWVVVTWREFLTRMRRMDELMMGNYMESLVELNETNRRLKRELNAREAGGNDDGRHSGHTA